MRLYLYRLAHVMWPSVPKLIVILAIRYRRSIGQRLTSSWRLCRDRLVGLSTIIRAKLQSDSGGGLLYLGLAVIRIRNVADGCQLLSNYLKDACPWHESDAYAYFYLVSTLYQYLDRCRFPSINRNVNYADA